MIYNFSYKSRNVRNLFFRVFRVLKARVAVVHDRQSHRCRYRSILWRLRLSLLPSAVLIRLYCHSGVYRRGNLPSSPFRAIRMARPESINPSTFRPSRKTFKSVFHPSPHQRVAVWSVRCHFENDLINFFFFFLFFL